MQVCPVSSAGAVSSAGGLSVDAEHVAPLSSWLLASCQLHGRLEASEKLAAARMEGLEAGRVAALEERREVARRVEVDAIERSARDVAARAEREKVDMEAVQEAALAEARKGARREAMAEVRFLPARWGRVGWRGAMCEVRG